MSYGFARACKVPPISILDEDFQKEVGNRNRTKTKAAEVEHAIRHHLDVELDDDPDLHASFAAALAEIFEQFRNNWNKIHEELEKLRGRILNANKEPTYGLHRKKQMPFFRSLKREIYGEAELDENAIGSLVSQTQHVFLVVERELRLTGFWDSIPARQKLREEIQKTLLGPDFFKLPGIIEKRAHIISRIMEIAALPFSGAKHKENDHLGLQRRGNRRFFAPKNGRAEIGQEKNDIILYAE